MKEFVAYKHIGRYIWDVSVILRNARATRSMTYHEMATYADVITQNGKVIKNRYKQI
jgi:hypothetical protein